MRSTLKSMPGQVSVPGRLGPFEVVSLISAGGMATVYLARAPHLAEPLVALKVVTLHVSDSSLVAREFIEEVKLTSQIHHPNVVRVLDVGQTQQGLFLALEYVEGDTLSGLLRVEGPCPRPVALRIL